MIGKLESDNLSLAGAAILPAGLEICVGGAAGNHRAVLDLARYQILGRSSDDRFGKLRSMAGLLKTAGGISCDFAGSAGAAGMGVSCAGCSGMGAVVGGDFSASSGKERRGQADQK